MRQQAFKLLSYLIPVSILLLAGIFVYSAPVGTALALHSALWLSAFALLFLLYFLYPKIQNKGAKVFTRLLLLALPFLFIFYPPSDDVNRYLLEGHFTTQGLNPYQYSLDEGRAELKGSTAWNVFWEEQYRGANHPEQSAAYGPLFQVFMSGFALTKAPLFIYKCVFAVLALGLLLLVFNLLKKEHLDERVLFTLGFNPLVWIYIYGEAHLDLLMMIPLILAIPLRDRLKARHFFFFSLALQIKLSAIVFAPLFLSKRFLRFLPVFLIPFSLYFFFQAPPLQYFESLIYFGGDLRYNSSLYPLLEWLSPSGHRFFLLAFLSLISFMVIAYSRDNWRRAFFLYLAFLLFSPTVHPWYLLPLLVFNLFYVSYSTLLFSLLFVFTFPLFSQFYRDGLWQEYPMTRFWIYGLYFPLLLADAFFFQMRSQYRKRTRGRTTNGNAFKTDIIVPTYNEEKTLGACLEALFHEDNKPFIGKVVISDGGSEDKTKEIASAYPVQWTSGTSGRGQQIAKALEVSENDWQLVLHSDVLIHKHSLGKLARKILADDSIHLAAFSMSFRSKQSKHWLKWLNDIRAYFMGIPFGDQMMCFHKPSLDAEGGFPDVSLMEDVELGLKLKRQGKLIFIPGGGSVSARTWDRLGAIRNALKIILLFHSYLLLRHWFEGSKKLNDHFYRWYYKRKTQEKKS